MAFVATMFTSWIFEQGYQLDIRDDPVLPRLMPVRPSLASPCARMCHADTRYINAQSSNQE